MASGGQFAYPSSKERTNYARLCRAIVDLGTQVLRDVLAQQISPGQIRHAAMSCRSLRLNAPQINTLNTAAGQGYVGFDISLLYILIRKLCPAISPTNGWNHGFPPISTEICQGDDIERVHFIRNSIYGHISSTCIPDTQFTQHWQNLSGVMTRIDTSFGSQYSQQLSLIENSCMDDVTENNYIQTIHKLNEDDKELKSEVQKLQAQVQKLTESNRLVPLSEKAAANQVRTMAMINGCKTDTRLLSTEAVTEGLKTLLANNVLIYSGVAGSGKTTNAAQVMNQFLDLHPDHFVFSVNNILDNLELESFVIQETGALLLLDDFLGRTNVNNELLDERGHIFEEICFSIRSRKLKIIMTIRPHILEQSLLQLEIHEMFKKKNIIDLSSDKNRLKKEEKMKIFQLHCQCNNFTIVDDECVTENYASEEIEDETKTVIIHQLRAETIIRTDPLIGFPQACFLFCSLRKYTKLGEKFFLHPSKSLVKEMDNLRLSNNATEKLKYCILSYMLMNSGQMELDNLDNKIWVNMVRLLQLEGSPSKALIKDALKVLTNKYIMNEEKSYLYKFKHETILEALAVSLGDFDMEFLLQSCDEPFIGEFCRTKQYNPKEGEVILMLKSTSEYQCLVNRFIRDMVLGKYWWVNHPSLDDPKFVNCLINTIQTDGKYLKVVRESCSKLEGIFTEGCKYDKYHLVDKLYTLYNKYIDTTLCLFFANYYHGTSTTKWLLNHQIDLDGIYEILLNAHTDKFNVILNHPNVQFDHVEEFSRSPRMRSNEPSRLRFRRTHHTHRFVDYNTLVIILNKWPSIKMNLVRRIFNLKGYRDEKLIEVLKCFEEIEKSQKDEDKVDVERLSFVV